MDEENQAVQFGVGNDYATSAEHSRRQTGHTLHRPLTLDPSFDLTTLEQHCEALLPEVIVMSQYVANSAFAHCMH
jgi:hypothetical protein